jgi:hypothetical protein
MIIAPSEASEAMIMKNILRLVLINSLIYNIIINKI